MTDAGPRFQRNPEIRLHALADGSAIAVDPSGEAFALNADAAAAWNAQASWSAGEMSAWLAQRGLPAPRAEASAGAFLEQLARLRLYLPAGTAPGRAGGAEAGSVAYYRMWRTTMRVITDDAAVARAIDRLCRQFSTEPSEEAIEFEVRRCQEHGWHIEREGRRLATEDDAIAAATQTEFEMVDTAVIAERGFIHWHGSGLTREGRAILIPGQGRAGKTTLSLAMTEQGFELLGEDVVFVDPATRLVHPFQRAILLRDGTQAALRRAGVKLPNRSQRIGRLLPVEAVRHWRREPAELAMVLLVDWDEAGPVEIIEIGQAEAAVEIRAFSHNLKRRRDGGWARLAQTLSGVRCYRLLRSQDLVAAAAAIRQLLDED